MSLRGFPPLQRGDDVHRGQLQVLLLRAARERIGDENYSGGLQLISFEQNPSLVTATFRDSKTGTTVVDSVSSTVATCIQPIDLGVRSISIVQIC